MVCRWWRISAFSSKIRPPPPLVLSGNTDKNIKKIPKDKNSHSTSCNRRGSLDQGGLNVVDFTALNSNLNWLIVPLREIFLHLLNRFGGIIFFLEV